MVKWKRLSYKDKRKHNLVKGVELQMLTFFPAYTANLFEITRLAITFVPLRIKPEFLNIMMTKHRSSAYLLVTLVLLFTSHFSFAQDTISKEAPDIAAGKALFNANCKSCHALDRKVLGPPLAGVVGRAPSIPWIKDWIHNS